MPPALDLRSLVRSAGVKMILLGIGAFVVGGIALAIGLMTGFMLCIALPLLIASPFAVIWGFVQLVYPEVRFGHLGAGPQRAAAIQHAEAEARDPRAGYWRTQRGQLWLTPTWVLLFGGDDVVVVPRRDVLYVYPAISRGRRSTTASLKLRTRHGDFSCVHEEMEQEWFVRTIASAVPWAFVGYDPRLVSMPRPQLAYEVDQRMQRMLPPG